MDKPAALNQAFTYALLNARHVATCPARGSIARIRDGLCNCKAKALLADLETWAIEYGVRLGAETYIDSEPHIHTSEIGEQFMWPSGRRTATSATGLAKGNDS